MKRLLKTFELFSILLPLIATLLVASCSDIDGGGGHKDKKKRSVLTINIGESETEYARNLAKSARTIEPLQENQELNDFVNLKLTYKDEGGILHCIGASASDNVIEWDTVTALNTEKKTLVIPVSALYDFTLTCFRYGTPFFQTIKKQVTVGEPIALSFNALTVDEEKIKRAATSSTPSTPPSTPPGANSSLLGVNSRADAEEKTAEDAQYKAGVTVSPKALLYLEVNYPPEKAIKKVEISLEDEDNSDIDNKITLEKVATLEAGATGITDNTTYTGNNTQEADKSFSLNECYIIKDTNGNITRAVLSLSFPSCLPLVTFLAYTADPPSDTSLELVTAERATLINGYKSRLARDAESVNINREHKDIIYITFCQNSGADDTLQVEKRFIAGEDTIPLASSFNFSKEGEGFKGWSTYSSDIGDGNPNAGEARFSAGDQNYSLLVTQSTDADKDGESVKTLTLYAIWSSGINVIYYRNWSASDNVDDETHRYIKELGKVTELNTGTKPLATITELGMTSPTSGTYTKEFLGWDTKEDGTGYRYTAGQNVKFSEAKTLYAQWCVKKTSGTYEVSSARDFNALCGSKDSRGSSSVSYIKDTDGNSVIDTGGNIDVIISLGGNISSLNSKHSRNKTLKKNFFGNSKSLSVGEDADTGNTYCLFNTIDSGVTVKELNLNTIYQAQNASRGVLCNTNKGTILTCQVNASNYVTFTNTGASGGLCGVNSGTITNCKVGAYISTSTVTGGLGGIAGTNSSNIKGCAFGVTYTYGQSYTSISGSLTANSATSCGGIAGINSGTITKNGSNYCEVLAPVTSTYSTTFPPSTGGVTGENTGEVSYCKVKGSVTGKNRVGGVIGYNKKTCKRNYYCGGIVTGGGNNARVGGIVGDNDYGVNSGTGTVKECMAWGEYQGPCSSNSAKVGGIIGQATSNSKDTDILSHCAAAGKIGGAWWIGGLVGYNTKTCARYCYTVLHTYDLSNCGTDNDNKRSDKKNVGGLYGYEAGGSDTDWVESYSAKDNNTGNDNNTYPNTSGTGWGVATASTNPGVTPKRDGSVNHYTVDKMSSKLSSINKGSIDWKANDSSWIPKTCGNGCTAFPYILP